MRLFIDECLSPSLASDLNAANTHVAVHPLHYGRRGQSDHTVLSYCIAENLVIVTQNARDFRALVVREPIHPGLIILPCVGKARSKELLDQVIAHLTGLGDPMLLMINKVLEIGARGAIQMYNLPEN